MYGLGFATAGGTTCGTIATVNGVVLNTVGASRLATCRRRQRNTPPTTSMTPPPNPTHSPTISGASLPSDGVSVLAERKYTGRPPTGWVGRLLERAPPITDAMADVNSLTCAWDTNPGCWNTTQVTPAPTHGSGRAIGRWL